MTNSEKTSDVPNKVQTNDALANLQDVLKQLKHLIESSKDTQESKDSREEFLAEVKEQFERDLKSKDAQDSKIGKMITISSTIATLLVGLGAFLVTRIESRTGYILSTL